MVNLEGQKGGRDMGMDPATLAIAATVMSAGIQGMGAIQQSQASAASAGYNAQVASQNAQLQERNAQFASEQGNQDVGAAGAQTKAKIAATLANQGASGIDVNTGSNVDVRESEAKLGMLNALTVRSNAVKQAYGYQVQSASDTGQAQLDKSQQRSDTTGGYLSAGADVLGGAGKAYSYLPGSGSSPYTPQFASYANNSSPIQMATATGTVPEGF
jgi:hypothetical protein